MEKKTGLEANKMHLEQFQKIMQTIDRDEAKSAAYILVRKYPDIVIEQLGNYTCGMKSRLSDLSNLMGGAD